MLLPSSFLGILTLIILLPCFDCKLCNENPPTSYLCTFQNGSKIDLTPLAQKDKPGLHVVTPDMLTEYTYNPRYKFTIDDTCKDAAACQSVTDADTKAVSNYLLATQEVDSWNECTATSSGEKATCIYFKKIETTDRITILELICDLNGGDTKEFKFIKEEPKLTYNLSLKSKYACATTNGLSFGSILCITFSVLVIVYVVVGILVNRFVRGATGLELFPNYQFWSGFPSLVKIDQCANKFLQNMDLPKFKIYSVF